MVPYFQANPRITYAEAAADLGVSVEQLRDDLNQLWMCGLPGYGPGDLIDFEFSGDTIEVTFSAGIDHPLRLTSPEATGVLVALRALVDVPGHGRPGGGAQRDRQDRVRRRHRRPRCRGAPSTSPRRSRARPPPRCATAVRGGRALSIEYYSASHDMLSSGSSTRSGWCWSPSTATWRRGAGPPRGCGCSGSTASSTPRVLDEPSAPPRARRAGPPGHVAVRPRHRDPSLPSATLLIDRSASWMFDYYPLRVLRELPRRVVRGRDDVRLRPVDGPVRAGLRLGRAGARAGSRWPSGCGELPWPHCDAYRVGNERRAGRLGADVWR